MNNAFQGIPGSPNMNYPSYSSAQLFESQAAPTVSDVHTIVHQALNELNLPNNPQLVNGIMRMIQPSIAEQMHKADQSHQTAIELMHIIKPLLIQNQSQILELAKLKKDRHEKPRSFSIDENGCGICIEPNGTEIKVGHIQFLSVYDCQIHKDGTYTDYKYIVYSDSKQISRHTAIPLKKLAEKSLLGFFPGFEYCCKNKQIANNYLAWCINHFPKVESITIPEHPGFTFLTVNDRERAVFDCNDGNLDMEFLNVCSEHYTKKILPKAQAQLPEILSYSKTYLNTPEKCLLFIYSICGLLSSFLSEIGMPFTQILVISSPNSNATRQAGYYLKTYNRAQNPISFDSNKATITKTIHHAKDETVIINDCSIIDNHNRRTDMLQHILTTNADSECLPHNMAIFSPHAQYIIPYEQKICLTLPDNFAIRMTATEEREMCHALDCLTRYMIHLVCSNYEQVKSELTDLIETALSNENNHFPDVQSRTSYAILSSLAMYFYSGFPSEANPFSSALLLFRLLNPPAIQSGSTADAIVNEWITQLNQSIHSDKIQIILHSKNMNFEPGKNQLIIKDDLLILEEQTIRNTLLSNMQTTDSVHRILKSLEEMGLLHATKKDRYPLTVYANGKSLRPSFIAVYNDGILDSDIQLRIKEIPYSEWFSNSGSNTQIPIITNSLGYTAYQQFDFDRAANMHCLVLGQSSSGKTHHLTERICSLQKLHHPIVIFDTSDSFTEETILHHLSIGGDETTTEKVKRYIKNHITFHNIEEHGIPVDMQKLNLPELTESKVRTITSIIESHNSNMGKKQKAALYATVKEMVTENNISMDELYYRLTSDKLTDSLVMQFKDMLSCFVEFRQSEKSWDEFLTNSKDIIVISTHAVSASGGSGLIDMLLMSLFYYQKSAPYKHLSIFIDEIKNQNLNSKGPIALILTEGRKYHIGLNYATQYLPTNSADTVMIMENADLKVFFHLDGRAATSAAKHLNLNPSVLSTLNTGECFVKGTLLNHETGKPQIGIIHGHTYRNFIR